MPRGFPDDFEFADDLKRKNFVALRAIDDDDHDRPAPAARRWKPTSPGLGPFVDYLCAALDLEF